MDDIKLRIKQQESIIRFLASMPGLAHCAIRREELQEILLATDGELILCGKLYNIKSKHLGAGIYSVTTRPKEK